MIYGLAIDAGFRRRFVRTGGLRAVGVGDAVGQGAANRGGVSVFGRHILKSDQRDEESKESGGVVVG